MVDDINDYIGACQVGITAMSIGIGALGEPVVAGLLEPLFGDAISHGLAVAISVGIAYLIITSAHIVAGELVPKIYAIDRAEGVLVRIARPLKWSRVLFHPFIVVLTAVSNRILRLLGVDPDAVGEEGGTPEEIKRIITQSYTGGQLDENEAGMLTGVFHLHEQQARQVMTPAPAGVTGDDSHTLELPLRPCVPPRPTRPLGTQGHNHDPGKGHRPAKPPPPKPAP